MTTVGVDGCRNGWIAAVDEGLGGAPRCERFERLSDLMRIAPSVVAIDVPIGLLERGKRECDPLARQLLQGRRNSVFTAPIRPVLTARTYEEACSTRFATEGKKLSRQAYGILCKVVEVDEALRAHPTWRPHVREVHPELCFYHLNEQRPMSHPKKRRQGRDERLVLLRREFGGAVDSELARVRGLGCKPDDIIDAFVALWTARRIETGVAVRLPADPPRDEFKLPMEMVA